MKPPEVAAITAFQSILHTLDGLPSQRMRRFVVKMVADYEQVRECKEYSFGESESQTVAR